MRKNQDIDELKKIQKDRKQLVAKSNQLIQKARYDLAPTAQKVVLYCISKIKPTDSIDTEYKINLNDLCQCLGLNMNEGNYYGYLKGIFLDLCQRQWTILPDGAIATISWIGDAKIPKNDSNVYIRFNSNLQPYLYELQTKYTTYELQNVLVLKGKYAIRLYEILRSHTTAKQLGHFLSTEAEYSIEQLRELLMVDGYKRWSDFESKVISPAIKEINTYSTDIAITYKPIKQGRKMERIVFTINSPHGKDFADREYKGRMRLKNQSTPEYI